MMHDQTITLYNYHEPSGLWYTTVFEGVQLAAASASSATTHGNTDGDSVSIIIPAAVDKTAASRQYIGCLLYTSPSPRDS